LSEVQVRSAYRRLAVLLHPDKCAAAGAAAAFALIRTALDIALPAAAAAAALDDSNAAVATATGGVPQSSSRPAAAAAAATCVFAAPNSRVRRCVSGLQVVGAVRDCLTAALPQGWLPPMVKGEIQAPLLLLVEVPHGEWGGLVAGWFVGQVGRPGGWGCLLVECVCQGCS
jgi:hypothetical protein